MNDTEARLALMLTWVLEWENPDGKIRDAYLPHWLVEKCDEAIREVPPRLIRHERRRNTYPDFTT